MQDYQATEDEILKDLVKRTEETSQIGAASLSTLHDQRQQLERITGRLDGMNSSLRQSEQTLDRLERLWGIFPTSWTRVFRSKAPQARYDDLPEEPDLSPAQHVDALDAIGANVQILKQQALTMNQELESQNKILDTINVRVSETDTRIHRASKRTGKLL